MTVVLNVSSLVESGTGSFRYIDGLYILWFDFLLELSLQVKLRWFKDACIC
jgi:hypothetical protein